MLPTHSRTASTPWPPVSFLTSSAASSPEVTTTSVAHGVGERGEHEVTALEAGHLGAGVLVDAEKLVPHLPAMVAGRLGAVGVQVAAADRGAAAPARGDEVARPGAERRSGYLRTVAQGDLYRPP
jgi:hypothetical protein